MVRDEAMKWVGALLATSAVFCSQLTPASACGPGLGGCMWDEDKNEYECTHTEEPEDYPLADLLQAPESYASQFRPWSGGTDSELPEQALFNYPFKLAPDVGSRWEELTGFGRMLSWPPPDDKQLAWTAEQDLKEFVAALGHDDRATAHRLASQAVEQVLDLPAARASNHALTLRRAVEFLELEPLLTKVPAAVMAAYFSHQPTPAALPSPLDKLSAVRGLSRPKMGGFARKHPKHPRLPSLQFVEMQEQLKQGLPDGWNSASTRSPEVLEAVRQEQQAWLAAWPQHPLADLVRLLGVRLGVAEGDNDGAWKAALSVYPRHRMRAVGEWDYLINLRRLPDDLEPYEADPYLHTALVLTRWKMTQEEWAQEWAFAQAHLNEPWAVLLQERLLYFVSRAEDVDRVTRFLLPKGLPSPTAPAPTTDWALLRVAVLLKAHRFADVAQALESIAPPPSLLASLALEQGHPQEAVRVKGLDEHARAYLLRTRLSDAELQTLAQGPAAPLATEAAQVRAERRIALGDWAGAAATVKEPERARRYEAMAKLAADRSPAGQLTLARALRDQAATLLPLGQDVEWYRSVQRRRDRIWWAMDEATLEVKEAEDLNLREAMRASEPIFSIPPDEEERYTDGFDDFLQAEAERSVHRAEPTEEESVRAHTVLLAGNVRVLSLEAFARYLAAPNTPPAEARRVLEEAQGLYTALIGWDNPTTRFYRDALQDSDAARALRAAELRLKDVK